MRQDRPRPAVATAKLDPREQLNGTVAIAVGNPLESKPRASVLTSRTVGIFPAYQQQHELTDDIGDGTHVCNESSRFVARQAVSLGTKTEDDLVAIHDIDIEMDSNTRAPQRFDLSQSRSG